MQFASPWHFDAALNARLPERAARPPLKPRGPAVGGGMVREMVDATFRLYDQHRQFQRDMEDAWETANEWPPVPDDGG